MIILYGTKGFKKELGSLTNVPCPGCSEKTTMQIVRVSNFFTVFFIPLIPIGKKYHTFCTNCGTAFALNKLKGKEFDRDGQTHIEAADLR